MCKVSIVVPIYNVGQKIEKTIKSIISQDCDRIELLLVNDGSTDNSIKIATDILNKTSIDYRVINQENSGVSTARNTGIEEAKGKYIYLLDSDDYIDSNLVSKLYNKAECENADIVYCDYKHVDRRGNELKSSSTKIVKGPIEGKDAAFKMLKNEFWVSMISGFYKRSLLIDNNIRFSTDKRYAEDTVFVLKALISANYIVGVENTYSYYVRWEDSVTNTVSLKHVDSYYSYVELYEYVERIDGLKPMAKYIKEFKIPWSICHIFSVLSTDKKLSRELMDFIKKDYVKKSLRECKLQSFSKNDIRFFIQSKWISLSPKTLMAIINKLK